MLKNWQHPMSNIYTVPLTNVSMMRFPVVKLCINCNSKILLNCGISDGRPSIVSLISLLSRELS